MARAARIALGSLAALLVPACTLTYVPDQTVVPGNPGLPFVLLLPLDGELQASASPQFAWNAYPGAMAYQLEISTASDFSKVVWDDPTLTITSTFLTQVQLTNFTTFYWRINALLSGGGKVLAGGSPFQFRTQGGGFTIPVPFATQYPQNGLVGVTLSPQFAWQPSNGATSYRVELDTVPTFQAPVIVEANVHINRATLSTPLVPGMQYFWRVLATGQLGNRYSDVPAALFQTIP